MRIEQKIENSVYIQIHSSLQETEKFTNDLHAQRNSILNVLALERNKKTHSTECKGKTKTPQKTHAESE